MTSAPISARFAAFLDSMGKILTVMVAFGLTIGLVFPFVVDPFATWNPGEKIYFRVISLAAGFLVGIFCFFLVKITIYPKNLLLARQKSEWETCFDSLAEGIVLLDSEGTIRRANRAFADMLDADLAGLEGKELAAVMAERCGKRPDECLITDALQTGIGQRGESALAGRVCTQTVNPIFDEHGQVTGCVFVLRDVTEGRRLQQQLTQSARMAAVSHLVSGAAHEINNPLMGVTGIAELILARGDIDDKLSGDVERVLHEARRASGIVKHLLAYVSTGAGQPCEVEINNLVREAVDLKEYNLKTSHVAFEVSLNQEPLLVTAEPDQLKQVFFHLIDNAEQALLKKENGRLLKVMTEAGDSAVRIHFIDNGPGVAPDVADSIFDPFFTTRTVGEGTGLGLTMSYSTAREMSGRLWLEENTNGGAHFILELPLAGEDR